MELSENDSENTYEKTYLESMTSRNYRKQPHWAQNILRKILVPK